MGTHRSRAGLDCRTPTEEEERTNTFYVREVIASMLIMAIAAGVVLVGMRGCS